MGRETTEYEFKLIFGKKSDILLWMEKDNSALHEFIYQLLREHKSSEDVVLAVCQKSGMYWSDAQELVLRVKNEKQPQLERAKIPWHFTLALMTALGGVACTIAAVIPFLNFFGGPNAIPLTQPNILFFVYNLGSYSFSLLLTGCAMFAGSLIGMRATWADLLEMILEALEN
jgi:hypothetical protein